MSGERQPDANPRSRTATVESLANLSLTGRTARNLRSRCSAIFSARTPASMHYTLGIYPSGYPGNRMTFARPGAFRSEHTRRLDSYVSSCICVLSTYSRLPLTRHRRGEFLWYWRESSTRGDSPSLAWHDPSDNAIRLGEIRWEADPRKWTIFSIITNKTRPRYTLFFHDWKKFIVLLGHDIEQRKNDWTWIIHLLNLMK